MSERLVPFYAKLSLAAGVALIWLWELCLATLGNRGALTWTPLVAGCSLLVAADVAIGSRWVEHRESIHTKPLYRRASSRVFNLCTQRLLGLKFHDTQCGLKALTRDAAKDLCTHQSIDGWEFDPEILFVAGRLGYQVVEVSIQLQHDYSSSKFRPFEDGFITFRDLFQIVWRDMLGGYPRPIPAPAGASTAAASPGELTPMTEAHRREAA